MSPFLPEQQPALELAVTAAVQLHEQKSNRLDRHYTRVFPLGDHNESYRDLYVKYNDDLPSIMTEIEAH